MYSVPRKVASPGGSSAKKETQILKLYHRANIYDMSTKVAVLLDSSREFRVSTLDLNHFVREETVLAGLRF
jgi:hypothetical protein